MFDADENQLVYTPPPSLVPFLTGEKFIELVVGPVGSTKTTAGIMKIAYHAKKMAPCKDGVRRSRAVWVRNTREQLADTSIPDFLKWYKPGIAGDYYKTEKKFVLKFDDVECEVLFRGLDDTNDVRRLLSLQASFAIFDEFREIHRDIFEAMQGRLGRYPDKLMVPHRPEWGVDEDGRPVAGCVTDAGENNKHLWGMSNPPDMDTFWEEFLTNPPSNAHITFQPSGLSPEADWVEFLPSSYYTDLIEGKTEDWVDVYIHAKFGKSLAGKPVFRSFNRDIHVAKEPLKHIKSGAHPIIFGMDTGLNPAAVFAQIDPFGRLLVLASLHAEGMGALRFVRERVKPYLANRFPGMASFVIVDPAGMQRAQTDERTVVDILRAEQLAVRPARTNALPARISAVDAFLTRITDGKPAVLFDPDAAASLIRALSAKYRYRVKPKSGEIEDVPEKSHPWSDIADAFQYVCLHADSSGMFGGNTKVVAKQIQKAGFRWL